MNKLVGFFAILFFIMLFFFNASVFSEARGEIKNLIRVELAGGNNIQISSNDNLLIYEGSSGDLLDDSSKTMKFFYSLEFPEEIQTENYRFLTPGLKILSKSSYLYFNGSPYRGIFWIIRGGNKLYLINQLDIEDYICSVVGAEVPQDWPMEALKAQAVAARTYACFKIFQNKDGIYDVSSSEVKDQLYLGVASESFRGRGATSDTEGVVMTYSGNIIKAYYHSCCGGATQDGKDAFQEDSPYLKAVQCYFCNDAPHKEWRRIFDSYFLKSKLDMADTSQIENIILRKFPSGRVSDIIIEFNGSSKKISASQFRKLIGYNYLKSTFFDIELVKALSSKSVAFLNYTGIAPEYKVIKYTKSEIYAISSASSARLVNINDLYITGLASTDKFDLQGVNHGISVAYAKPHEVKSDDLEEKYNLKEVKIYGKGWGHGAGMCQWGSRKMGDSGYNYKNILEYYYTGIKFENIRQISPPDVLKRGWNENKRF